MTTEETTELANMLLAEVLREAAEIVSESGSTKISVRDAIDQAVINLSANSPFTSGTEH